LAIPLRRPFSHAAATRNTAQPIVVAVELTAGAVGYGETLPREYVTGESVDSVIDAVREHLLPAILEIHPENFPEALEQISALPTLAPDGSPITAARAGVELALLDAYSHHFQRPITEAAGWMGLPGLGPPGSLRSVRYSGIVGTGRTSRIGRFIRAMRCYGLRDFKLKVGGLDDNARVAAAVDTLGASLRDGSTTLRLDANSGWDLETARARLAGWEHLHIACVEQPLDKFRREDINELHRTTTLELMHDESLVTYADAESLVIDQVADWFNLRLSKNGGFLETMRLAGMARQHKVRCQLGCMVGETGILSAAGRRFLECVPDIEFAEGSYGRFLLKTDITRRPVDFGYGGKPKPLVGLGWGVDVEPERLKSLAQRTPIQIAL
jgi:muconate cycloisomerase